MTLFGVLGVLPGCFSTPKEPEASAPAPVAPSPAQPTLPGQKPAASGGEVVSALPPSRRAPPAEVKTPSLEEARRSQGELQADRLTKRTGVQLEVIQPGSAPAWWLSREDTKTLLGSARARSLEAAYDAAIAQAQSAQPEGEQRPSNATVSRSAYSRVFPSGDFTVWVAMRTDVSVTAPAAPRAPVEIPPTAVALPAPPPATGTREDPAGAAPAWWTQVPNEADGKVIVGAVAEAPTLREAPRLAVAAGRAHLAALLNKRAINDLTTLKSASVKLADGSYRTYVMVAAGGSLRK